MGHESNDSATVSRLEGRLVRQFEHATSYWIIDDGSECSSETIIDVFGRPFIFEAGITQFRALNEIALMYENPDDADSDYVDMTIYTASGFYYETRTQNGEKQRRVKGIKTLQGGWIPLQYVQSFKIVG